MNGFILDLYSGIHGAGRAFKDLGFVVIGVEYNEKLRDSHLIEYDEDFFMDAFEIDKAWVDALIEKYGPCLGVWASPPCTCFSIASCSTHWFPPKEDGTRIPRTEKAELAVELVKHTLKIIEWTEAPYFWIENPRGILRKLGILDHLEHTCITYCTYGENRMKPTDLWGRFHEDWEPRPMCYNGATAKGDCHHEPAPRGAKTGTQGLKGNALRSVVAYELTKDIGEALR